MNAILTSEQVHSGHDVHSLMPLEAIEAIEEIEVVGSIDVIDTDDYLSAYAVEVESSDDTVSCCDRNALFSQLVSQHQGRLYRFVTKYIDHPDDAADIAQQAFAEAARTIESFRGDSKLSTWLFGIAMNMVRNYLSRAPHRLYKFESEDTLTGLLSAAIDPSDEASQKELLKLVLEALAELPKEMSEVLTMVAVEEISYQEVAVLLSIPLGTVRSRVSRARAVLREHFETAGVSLLF
ncbi:MAG: RNA polymerase sigma factor [Janthinobacterium lividum]